MQKVAVLLHDEEKFLGAITVCYRELRDLKDLKDLKDLREYNP